MTHELNKLDTYLNIKPGTTYTTIIQHNDPTTLNRALTAHHITLDQYGMVPKHQHHHWQQLMHTAGISQKYWKDKNHLQPEATITNLEDQQS